MAEKQRILIVDDDANIAELISLYLMKECYETMILGDGEEALKAVSYTHLDVYKRQVHTFPEGVDISHVQFSSSFYFINLFYKSTFKTHLKNPL